jgi:poly-gamma-glutamate capsule biosynthesis protein CapA/YwtB (metallophosphatase superfamily)
MSTNTTYFIYRFLAITLILSLVSSCLSDKIQRGPEVSYLPDSVQLYQYAWDSLMVWSTPPPKEDTIRIVGVGDIMMGTNYPTKRTLPPKDGATLFEKVLPYLQNADLTFGNLEGVIGKGGTPKKCNNPDICYTFRMPARYTKHLTNAGFDFVSIANNHANDFGTLGRKSSAATLDTSGLHYAGSKEKPYTTFMKDSITYGFLATAPNSGCYNMKKYKAAAAIVAHLDSICDIVIVSFHAGAEGPEHRHTPRTDEKFYGANRGNTYKFSHGCIDAGADIIFGHGPHVTRAVELYKDRFIAYSMGNFCTYEKFELIGPKGVGPIIEVQVNKEGVFLGGMITPTKQIGEGIPVYDTTKYALKEVINLSKEDFPTSPLIIQEDGQVMRKIPLPPKKKKR